MLRAWRRGGAVAHAHPRARRALDAHLLLRPGHRGRQRRGLPDDRLPVPHRLGGGARPALRRDPRAARGQAQPAAGARPGPQVGHPARPVDRAEGGAAHGGAGRRRRDRHAARRADRRGGRARARGGAAGPRGLDRIVVSGLAGEFIQYLTTPEEYDRQHYEGGSTLYGPLSSNLLRQELAELARRLVSGEPAQAAYALDPTNGVSPNGPPYGSRGGARHAGGAARADGAPLREGAARLARRPPRPRPAARPRVRGRPAASRAALADGRQRPRPRACSGRSTTRAPTARSGRSRGAPRRAATGSGCARSATG